MTSSKYAGAMAMLEYHGALHTDAHMFFIKIQEENLDFIAEIMTQLPLKPGFKELGTKYYNTVPYDTKKINFLE